MRIDHYDLQGEVRYQQWQRQHRKVRILGPVLLTAAPPNTTATSDLRALTQTRALTRQAEQSTASQPAVAVNTDHLQEEMPNDGLDNRQRLIKLMLEAMLGRDIELPMPPNPSAAGGAEMAQGNATAQATAPDQRVTVTDTLLQQEQLHVVAAASVQTNAGQTLQLDLGFVLDWRQLAVEQRNTTLAALKDPLVLSLDGQFAELTEARVSFDIDQDGKLDNLPGLREGSGFVALDRNGNDTIDDGGELFGARSGNGFSELAALDEDGNGVLDEGDVQFSALQFWHPAHTPIALVELGIGAILLRPLDTPFTHLGEDGNLGALRQSGLYLTEQGKAGWVQQIDLRV